MKKDWLIINIYNYIYSKEVETKPTKNGNPNGSQLVMLEVSNLFFPHFQFLRWPFYQIFLTQGSTVSRFISFIHIGVSFYIHWCFLKTQTTK